MTALAALGPVQGLALLPDGKSVLAGHYGGGVSLSDIDSGQLLAEYVAAADKISVSEMSCSPDGSLIARGRGSSST
ncbi:MAG: WD40 repeat domain-containing protein [Planctomycetota bacterium]